jgi:hypothetical protein
MIGRLTSLQGIDIIVRGNCHRHTLRPLPTFRDAARARLPA